MFTHKFKLMRVERKPWKMENREGTSYKLWFENGIDGVCSKVDEALAIKADSLVNKEVAVTFGFKTYNQQIGIQVVDIEAVK